MCRKRPCRSHTDLHTAQTYFLRAFIGLAGCAAYSTPWQRAFSSAVTGATGGYFAWDRGYLIS